MIFALLILSHLPILLHLLLLRPLLIPHLQFLFFLLLSPLPLLLYHHLLMIFASPLYYFPSFSPPPPPPSPYSTFFSCEKQLYKRLCPSVHWLVGWSVRGHESKSGKTSVLDTFCVCLCVEGVWMGLGCGWGLDAPAHPSATIL